MALTVHATLCYGDARATKFWQLDNCHIDYRGQLIRDKIFLHSGSNRFQRLFALIVGMASSLQKKTTYLSSDTGKRIDDAYDKDAVVSMTNLVVCISEDVE